MKPNVVAIVQARMGSARLPGKVMKKIGDTPMIGLLLQRLAESSEIDKIVVATTVSLDDQPLVDYIQHLGFDCESGSEADVLDRYIQVADKYCADIVVRITGDCPLVDYELVDRCIQLFFEDGADYCSNILPPTYPDGLDVEIVRASALKEIAENCLTPFDREHVTTAVRDSNLFQKANFRHEQDLSHVRWTVDDLIDFKVISAVFDYFDPDIFFSWRQVFELYKKSPEIFVNTQTERNSGSIMCSGQKLWSRAKSIIPGGNMLLSKRPEMFLPDHWPTYFSKAKGCKVWDLDSNLYTDMSTMGVGTNILGYAHEEVDAAVVKAIKSGSMSSLNCPEEVYLAEKLVAMHPWAEMVRFARTGGEANAIAIRIARAAAGKDNVAFCGYHGWHDWYLSANLSLNQNLDGHLLPGLEPNGVPKNLANTVFPFTYNDLAGLSELIDQRDIGVIKMEVSRNSSPNEGFLSEIRDICTAKGIVLIFDECTSGFRETFGGLHKKYSVDPDIAIFGKALGNGYAISSVIGRREVMECAQSTFISSTFWTERVGPAAALKTLEIMEREKSWETISKIGLEIKSRWQALAEEKSLQISLWGLSSLAGFSFNSESDQAYKTLITQQMLIDGYLASNCVYTSIAHDAGVISRYFESLASAFELVGQCEQGRDVSELLQGPVCHSGFKRLN